MTKITLNMTARKSELLDSILKAFGNEEHLGKEDVLAIFDGNENLAADHINILAQLNYIQKIAEIEGSRLGMVFYKKAGTDLFLSEGGFTGKYNKELEAQQKFEAEKNLQQDNLILQNEALKHEATIRQQENRIRDLDERVKRFEMLKNYEWLIRLGLLVITALITWWVSTN